MSTERRLGSVIVVALGVGLGGCQAAQNAAAGAGAYMERVGQKLEQKTDDASVTLAVKGALFKADEKLAARVKVSTGKGVVSLVGVVPSVEDRARAEQIATGVSGVVRVINALDVGTDR